LIYSRLIYFSVYRTSSPIKTELSCNYRFAIFNRKAVTIRKEPK